MYGISKTCSLWTLSRQLPGQKLQVNLVGIARTFATGNGIYSKFGQPGVIPAVSHRKFQASALQPPGPFVIPEFAAKPTRFRHPSVMKLLKCSTNVDTPNLVLLFTWMEAKPSHWRKYAKLYLNKQCDVLVIRTRFVHTLWPGGQLQELVTDALDFLVEHPHYQKIITQAMSGGVFTLGFLLHKIIENPKKYQHLTGRMTAKVFDSVSLMDGEVLFGKIADALFPSNSLLSSITGSILKKHISLFTKQTTALLALSKHRIHENLPAHVPILVFNSRNDQFACLDCVEVAVQRWREKGYGVHFQLWDDSPHVGHLQQHKTEYEELLQRLIFVKLNM